MQFFRVVAYFLIGVGLILFADAVRDQQRGIAIVVAPTRSAVSSMPEVVRKIDHPERFEKAMLYQWARAGLMVCAGAVILGLYKRREHWEPFAQGHNKSKAIDEWGASLDAEAKRRRRPFHIWQDD